MGLDSVSLDRAAEMLNVGRGTEADVVALILSLNVERRHLSKGQQAMAIALAYPDGGKGGRGNKGEKENPAESAGFSARRLRKARVVLRWSRGTAANG